MKYPNRIQAAVLLDARFEDFDAVSRGFARLCEMKSDTAFIVAEHHPNRFARLTGGPDNLTVSFEYVNAPPAQGALEAALGSPVTTLLSPELPDRVAAAPAHILLEVSASVADAVEEALSPSPLAADLASANLASADLGAPPKPSGAQAFHQRLDTLSLMARVTIDHVPACAIHWTQSDQLLDPETFEAMATLGFPGPLAIHPRLFGVLDAEDSAATENGASAPAPEIGITTFGAAHWLGRELRVPVSPVPWTAAYETLLAFCELATMAGGYVIPDGDTFGPEDGSEVWRVHHREPEPGADADASDYPALYELVPLRHDACQFIAEDFARSSSVLSVRQPKSKATTADPQGAADRVPHNDPNHASTAATPVLEPEEENDAAELQAALAEGRAEAAANPPAPLAPATAGGTPSLAGDATVSGRSLRARVFGSKEA